MTLLSFKNEAVTAPNSNPNDTILMSTPNVLHTFKYRPFLFFILILTFGLALSPEQRTELLNSTDGWSTQGTGKSCTLLHNFKPPIREIRRSTVDLQRGQIFRTWVPDDGIVPLEVESSPFLPARFMSVVVTGTNRTRNGLVQAYIQCEENGQRLEIFRGSVNANLTEAIVAMPNNWCPGKATIKLKSTEKNTLIGIGDVFKISLLSYLKSSFIGRLPYFFTALAAFSFIMFSGASYATRKNWHPDPFPIALLSLGCAALGIFYLGSGILATGLPDNWRGIGIAVVMSSSALLCYLAGPDARRHAFQLLLPYAQIWWMTSLVYFALLSLTYNGLGHWEPNYRFWPAIWSSDNELPWMFAEAIRHGWDLKELFGGIWLPTDRPPLMAGSHLLLSDMFGLLQANNDGNYLNGPAYNSAAVALNSLWAPAALWLLTFLSKKLDNYDRKIILLFTACLPFIIFNTIYGWPKAFGGAYALLAFGLSWQLRAITTESHKKSITYLFFAACAFSMLAHASTALFLAPLGILFLIWNFQNNKQSILIGFCIALAMLASWSLYKFLILPSSNPVTKYALTGDFGFGHPEWSLWHMLATRYRSMSFEQWLEIKKIMMLHVFLPLHHPITQIELNLDYGTNAIDNLRAWDILLLSKGNIPILIFAIAASWVFIKSSIFNNNISQQREPFFSLTGISVTAWLIVVTAFLVPPVLHIWPQAAVLGLAIGGAVIVYQNYPLLFAITLIASMSYTGVVWIISPLQAAQSIDFGAALLLTALLSWKLTVILTPKSTTYTL